MTSMLRFLLLFTLGTWVGAGLFVTLVVAPAAFRLSPTPDVAGEIVGHTLTRLHLIGIGAGAAFLIAAALLGWGDSRGVARSATILVALMIVLTAASQFGVTPRMDALRRQMVAAHGSISATPREDPARVSFGKLHGISASLELVTLLAGAAAFFLAARDLGHA
jgi:Domain of unknown function (DUF4149)